MDVTVASGSSRNRAVLRDQAATPGADAFGDPRRNAATVLAAVPAKYLAPCVRLKNRKLKEENE